MKSYLLLCALALSHTLSAASNDIPELAQRGPFAVGVRTLELIYIGQVDVLHFDKEKGTAPLYDRPLKVEVWYPAVLAKGQVESTVYDMAIPGPQAGMMQVAGKAARNAEPAKGQRFPLVIVSHGYPGSRIFLSYLTEHLASRGYVVAAIDHTDSVLGEIRPFPSTLLNRANDQIFVLNQLVTDGIMGMVDPEQVAIIGYSMGGYGALASAGAGYSKSAAAMTGVPGGYLNDWQAGSTGYSDRLPKNLKAIVAIAPWGAQPPYNSWEPSGLAGIHIPSLFIAGDHDDVADYEHGIEPTFRSAVNSERCMLVYQNARHNTGGNPRPPGIESAAAIEFFDEPVWRKERICDINRHFVTAFLDLYLKGDASKRAYLQNGITEWKGFQRRWSLGLELRCLAGKQR